MHLMPLLRAKRAHFDLEPVSSQEIVPLSRDIHPSLLAVGHGHRLLGLPSPPAILFLGSFHPLGSWPSPDTWRKNGKIESQWLDDALADPDRHPDLLSYLLSLPPPASRAIYLCALARMVVMGERGTIPAHYFDAIRTEHTLFRAWDGRWIKRRVEPHIQVDGRHLLWTGPVRTPIMFGERADRPCVNWYDSKDVPVHRLLWPYAYQTDILQPRERLRRTRACPESEYPACVNPEHYEHSEAMTPRVHEEGRTGRSLKTQQASEYPSYTYRWDHRRIEIRGGREVVVCPEDHLFSERVQDSLALQRMKGVISPHGQAECKHCKKQYELATGGQRFPRRRVPGHAGQKAEAHARDVHIAWQASRDAEYPPKRASTKTEDLSDAEFTRQALEALQEKGYEAYVPDE